jgi:pimeloyl-ACP methyl ester carboxylesterase
MPLPPALLAVEEGEAEGRQAMRDNTIKRLFTQSLARKAGRIMLIVATILLACLLGLVGVLLLWSPGKPIPFVDENGRPLAGSISEKIHVDINGVEQGMFIKSKDETNPVLLFLHGGAGMPEYFLTQSYPTGLEEYFTVCWWERRGSGLSYTAGIPPETMTLEQMISDTLEVTNYLRHRFGKDKIYLMAHSGGSLIAIQAAARAPELYHAYVGVSQMTYQLRSERLAYEYMLKQFKENGNIKMVRKLEAAPVTMTVPLPESYMAVRDQAMHSLGIGTTHTMKSVITGVILPSWLSREYTLGEKVKIWRGKFLSDSILWDKIIATDLTQKVPELGLPVYFFHGIYDYTVSYTLAKSYFEELQAPLKGFYTFEQSAHSPMFEEPEKMRKIFEEDVLAGADSLADTK